MKTANIVIAILFLLFAAVQFNDPDPLHWIGYYILAAVASAIAARGIYKSWLLWGGLIISVIWMATLIPGVIDWANEGMPSITGSMKASSPYIELMREFLGVLLVLINFVFLLYQSKRKIN